MPSRFGDAEIEDFSSPATATNRFGDTEVEDLPVAPYVWNKAKQGLVEGTAGLAGLAADTGSMVASDLYNAVTDPETPFNQFIGAGAESAPAPMFNNLENMRAATDAGNRLLGVDPNMQAPNTTAKNLGGIAEFAAGGVIPSAIVLRAAKHKLPAVFAEITSSIGGGIGQENFGPWGGVIGGLGGATVSPSLYKAAAKSGQYIPGMRGLYNDTLGPDAARVNAGKELSGALSADPNSTLNLARAESTAAGIRGLGGQEFNPTLGQRSGSEGVVSIEQGIASSSPEKLARHEAATGAAQSAIGAAESKAFPGGGRVAPLASKKMSKADAALDQRLGVIADAERRIGDQFPDIHQQSIGEALNKARVEAMTIARGVKNQKYQDVYRAADEAKITADMGDVADLSNSLRGQNIFQRFPSVFGKIDARYAKNGASEPQYKMTGFDKPIEEVKAVPIKPASFEELHSLSRETNTQISAAMRSGDSEGAYYLTQVKELLDGKLAKFSGPEYGNVAELKQAADDFFTNKYARVFREGAGGRLAATNRFGDVVDDEKTIQKFFSPTGIDDFNEIFAGAQGAQEVLSNGVMGLFAKAALRDGTVNPKAAATWINRHKEALDKLPDVKAKLQNAKLAQEEIIRARELVASRQKAIDKTYISKMANTDDPDGLIQKALSNPKDIRGLTALASDPQSRMVVARTVMKAIPEAAARAGVDSLSFLTGNSEALRPLMQRLGPEHEKNLRLIAAAQGILERSPTPSLTRVQAVKDPIKEAIGSSLPELLNSWRAIARRQGSVFSATASGVGKFMNKKNYDAQQTLVENALYDPILAADLRRAISAPAVSPSMTNKISNHLISLGVRVGVQSAGEP